MGKEEPNKIFILLSYIVWIFALIIYFVRKSSASEFEKFHYKQALLLGVVGVVVSFIPFGLLSVLASFVIWLYAIYLGIKAITGGDPRPLKKYVDQYMNF